jgi:glycosyltransferase involved in cell wall biosynthesis
MPSPDHIIVTARDEAERLPATLRALSAAFPIARLVVADDGSRDATARVARAGGAEVVGPARPLGKGGTATLAIRHVLERDGAGEAVFLLCDADLGGSAERLGDLVGPVRRGEGDVAVAAFARRLGGGLGVAVGFARWAVRRRCGLSLRAPISGQRALRGEVMAAVLPFAPRFGMEMGMTIDAARAGYRVVEVEIDLAHRATGRSPGGFLHRARQLADFARVYLARR